MKPSEISCSLQLLTRIQKPAFLWGAPGVGKSQVVGQVAAALGVRLIDIRVILLDPVDLRGLPTVEHGKAAWAIPAFLPEDGAFVTRRDVPYTNNASERALRLSVIFRKVTNCFRAEWGAKVYAAAASVIATGRPHGLRARWRRSGQRWAVCRSCGRDETASEGVSNYYWPIPTAIIV
jgi:hypothetical protein